MFSGKVRCKTNIKLKLNFYFSRGAKTSRKIRTGDAASTRGSWGRGPFPLPSETTRKRAKVFRLRGLPGKNNVNNYSVLNCKVKRNFNPLLY